MPSQMVQYVPAVSNGVVRQHSYNFAPTGSVQYTVPSVAREYRTHPVATTYRAAEPVPAPVVYSVAPHTVHTVVRPTAMNYNAAPFVNTYEVVEAAPRVSIVPSEAKYDFETPEVEMSIQAQVPTAGYNFVSSPAIKYRSSAPEIRYNQNIVASGPVVSYNGFDDDNSVKIQRISQVPTQRVQYQTVRQAPTQYVRLNNVGYVPSQQIVRYPVHIQRGNQVSVQQVQIQGTQFSRPATAITYSAPTTVTSGQTIQASEFSNDETDDRNDD